jgi:hypothetical protein
MTHHDRVREQFRKQPVIVNNPTLEVMAAAVARLSARELRGRPALRICSLNPLVIEDDLRLLIEEIHTVGSDLSKQQ